MNSPDEFERDPELLDLLPLDGRAGPAARISKERALSMVEAALAGMPPTAAGFDAKVKGAGKLGRASLVAAAVLAGVVGGVAAARFYFAERAPAPAEVAAPPAFAAPTPAPEPAAGSEPSEVTPSAPQPARRTPQAVVEDEPIETARSERAAPEDLLQKANRLRTVGRFRQSAQTYNAVSERYPGTLSAYVAQVAAASLELEHLSSPVRARKLFERALREHPEGALDVEARQGLATALRDLGDRSAEAAALRSLIERHADSPAARRAQVRLQELGER